MGGACSITKGCRSRDAFARQRDRYLSPGERMGREGLWNQPSETDEEEQARRGRSPMEPQAEPVIGCYGDRRPIDDGRHNGIKVELFVDLLSGRARTLGGLNRLAMDPVRPAIDFAVRLGDVGAVRVGGHHRRQRPDGTGGGMVLTLQRPGPGVAHEAEVSDARTERESPDEQHHNCDEWPDGSVESGFHLCMGAIARPMVPV